MTLTRGVRLGPYEILAPLGAGGMGEVYKARDPRLGRDVAIKVLPAAFAVDRERLHRFEQEARAASALNHPHIVTIFDIGESDGGHFIVMELVAGRTLRAVVAERPGVDIVVRVGEQIAKALATAHAAGIVHRDIKPENVMVRDDGYVKVLDFGLARLVPSQAVTSATPTALVTGVGATVGTACYMSPEQARGDPVDGSTDVFSLGLVLYELATGAHPFLADSSFGILHNIVSARPLSPSRANPEIPAGLEGLMLQSLDKDPCRRPTAAEVAEVLGAISRAPAIGGRTAMGRVTRHTVGREHERAALQAAFEHVAAGRGLLMSVAGEPGIGKTTLVEDFLADVAVSGEPCRIARGRCSERLAGTEAYLPLLEVLDTLLYSGSGDLVARTMRAIAPTWYVQLRPLTAGEAAAMPQAQAASPERLKRELGAVLRDLARQRPVLLFFDDVHWADVSTIECLAYLATKFDEMRLLVLATYRPAELLAGKHPFQSVKLDLEARGLAREMLVPFLAQADIERYLALEFPSHRFPATFPALIHARTEGSPLFMADVVHYLRDCGVIVPDDGGWRLAEAIPAIERALPASIRSMIQRKIEQLTEADRRMLLAASVQGHEFDSAILTKVLAMDTAEIEEQLDRLDRVHGFVRPVKEHEFHDGTFTLAYRFVHVLYQNALYESLTPARKTSWSARVAEALLEAYGDRRHEVASNLAFLFEAARDFGQATHYFAVAAENALEIFANREAALLARRGIQLLERLPAAPERINQELALQLTLALALRNAIGFGAAEVGQAYARARELCQSTAETVQLFPVLRGLWEFYELRGEYKAALELADQCFNLAETAHDSELLLVAHDISGDTRFWLGEFLAAREHLNQGLSLYDAQRHRAHPYAYGYDSGVTCLVFLAITLWHLGYPDQAVQRCDEALSLARRVSHPFTLAHAQVFGALVHTLRRDGPAAQELAEAAIGLCREHDIPFYVAWGGIMRGWSLAEQGGSDDGIAALRQALKDWRAIGSDLSRPFGLALLAESYGKAGQPGEGLALLDEALAQVEQTGERFYEAEVLRLKGELFLQQAHRCTTATTTAFVPRTMPTGFVEAEDCFRQAIAVARRQQARSLELRAVTSLSRLLAQDGRHAEARAMLGEIYGWFTEGFDAVDLKDATVLLEQLS